MQVGFFYPYLDIDYPIKMLKQEPFYNDGNYLISFQCKTDYPEGFYD